MLYVQHAGCLGGSAISLRYLVQGMQEDGVRCTVALARPSDELVEFYAAAGITTIPAAGLVCWDHSTVAPRSLFNPRHVLELCGVAAGWRASQRETLRLVDRIGPDIVHLNSMPLSSSASALTAAGVPFVWHVREPPPDQGLRTAAIRRMMLAAPSCIFITRYDQAEWIGDAPARVVYNCVPDDWFQRTPEDRPDGPETTVRFAYLGGFASAKGDEVFLDALRIVRQRLDGWRCLMPGCIVDASGSRRRRFVKTVAMSLGVPDRQRRLQNAYERLAPAVELMPFTKDIPSLLGSVDFLVFPATRPHFPRPVIEAAALSRPAVGTDVGGVNECIVHEETGLLCRPDDPGSLADAIQAMILRPDFRRRAGAQARERAVAIHTLSAQRAAVAEAYGDLLARCPQRSAGPPVTTR